MIIIPYEPQPRQCKFHESPAEEVLYGGAAGGGKSEAILFDALANALEYENCRIIIFRRKFPDLKRSLILRSLQVFPKELGKYNSSDKVWTFYNNSTIEFAYWDDDSNYMNYQGAEYDFVYWDELTQFKEEWYMFMLSRLRGSKGIHRQVKSASNPGGIGHGWVKGRFIDPAPAEKLWRPEATKEMERYGIKSLTRCFIPAKVFDNQELLKKDPNYLARLLSLPDDERRAYLDGDWDVFAGQYYREFRREIHTCRPFEIPSWWKRFRSLDYGLDMTACYWWACSPDGKYFIYRELYQPGLNLTQAAEKIVEMTPPEEEISYTVASPDLWNRRQETGYSGMEIMSKAGLSITRAKHDRVAGWRALREFLTPYEDEQNVLTARIQIFDSCTNLIRTLPQLTHDERNPEDVASQPHEITHAPESIRYGVMSRPPLTREEKLLFDKRVPAAERAKIAINISFEQEYTKMQQRLVK